MSAAVIINTIILLRRLNVKHFCIGKAYIFRFVQLVYKTFTLVQFIDVSTVKRVKTVIKNGFEDKFS